MPITSTIFICSRNVSEFMLDSSSEWERCGSCYRRAYGLIEAKEVRVISVGVFERARNLASERLG